MAATLIELAWSTPGAQSLARCVEAGGVLRCAGVAPPAQAFLAALLRWKFPDRPLVAVAASLKGQESFHQDLETWFALMSVAGRPEAAESPPQAESTRPKRDGRPPARHGAGPAESPALLFFPAWEVLPHEGKLPHADVISERLETLLALAAFHPATPATPAAPSPPAVPVVTTNILALLQRTFAPVYLRAHTRRLARGDALDPLELIEWLEAEGYEPEAQVTQKGEIAWRGGILDVYPPSCPWPVRLEFFGNELDSLRFFDPATQVSREQVGAVTLPPAGEFAMLRRLGQAGKSCAVKDSTCEAQSDPTDVHGSAAKQAADVGPSFGGLGSLLEYLPPATILLWLEPDELQEQAERYAEQLSRGDPLFLSWDDVQTELQRRAFTRLEVTEQSEAFAVDAAAQPASGPTPQFQSLELFRPLGDRPPEPQVAEAQRREFFAQLHRWLRQGCAVHVFCNNEGERQRFAEIWNEYGLNEATGDAPNAAPPGLCTHLGSLSRGFLCEAARFVVVTDAEIFARYRVQRPRRLKSPHAAAARSLLEINFTELEEGDYVVHLEHGIGRYLGLQTLLPGAQRQPAAAAPADAASDHDPRGQECLVIEYAPAAPGQAPPKLYVPVTEAHLVSKYVGASKARPQLSTLGGKRWSKAKEQAERAVRDLAADLLSIQAAREALAGHAFGPDTAWQREFESAFLYEETPDQARAIADTKADMERPRPMDRLICGDVGFGKTEVAIRAAFKCVMDGKQVAVLVPTTVLAQQHFNTFRERMADYPVRIELLSRFRSRRQQQQVVRDLANGVVDIVIGTHRLLQGDVVFKDLGLVVIDEEQRFGVLQKEKFKQMRKLVDVLTLTATPIPRTLYLALTGARDMSTIETPPQDRLPVETIVVPYDEQVIANAIQRELNRGGQVFFLHNRVMTIELMFKKLQALVPRARIVVGHGQMHSDDLEAVMTRFVNGQADVLLSTTIIESGLDIPNANTIIIDRADRFGLSDLYQLRGRVGRYKHQAYAYFLLPRHAGLLSDARKRISAIKQYSSLGSGFRIAMRDLEIRGAGNVLGPEQSGHITAVGFDLYCQLLKQSIAALKGEPVKPRVRVEVRLDFLPLGAPGEDVTSAPFAGRSARPARPSPPADEPRIEVPREVAVWVDAAEASRDAGHGTGGTARSQIRNRRSPLPAAAAYLPLRYIRQPQHRIDVYRKLAQATDLAALEAVRAELRDRFGPLPPPVELLLQLTELKLVAAERSISAIEVEDDKLKLTRNGDLLMPGGKFPRLTRRSAKARLAEIKKLLRTL